MTYTVLSGTLNSTILYHSYSLTFQIPLDEYHA